MQQTANTILMIRPVNFRQNEQTAVNNHYQKELVGLSPKKISSKAKEEFDAFVEKLRGVGVQVIVVDDTADADTPDAVFPNNWISFHENGNIGVYPMFAKNRRLERREDILEIIETEGFQINNVFDYTEAEEEELFLEGTGSLLLDRVNQKAYCAISARADEDLFIEFCEDFEYSPVIFTAYQTVNDKRKVIYHTNVMLCLGETFAVICLDAIDDKKERKAVVKSLREDGKEVIVISEEQVNQFAGNMLQVKGANEELFIVMSQSAYDSLRPAQIEILEKHSQILSSDLATIETCGGGSARCMMAEVFFTSKINDTKK